jgi:ADP-heptose:LPS heptosyltransferase
MRRKQFIIITWGGIGDLMICTPTLRAVRKKYPRHKIIVYCSRVDHMKVLKHNPHVDSVRMLSAWGMWKYPYHLFSYLFDRSRIKYTELAFQYVPPNWYGRTNIKQIAGHIFDLDLQGEDARTELFFTKAEDEKAIRSLAPYRNVIIMHIYSRCSPNHLWATEKWSELVKQLPQYTFVQVGGIDEPKVEGAVDFRGKTTLREAFCLIKHASSFIGVDSIHSHVTNAFKKPGVVLFGDSDPAVWGHDNNINVFKGIPCSPCFYMLWGSRCPYNNECMKLIEVEEVREAVIKQMQVAS